MRLSKPRSWDDLERRLAAGDRLDEADGLGLYAAERVFDLAAWADRAKHRHSGTQVFFAVNRHVNYTNICRCRCRFCRFGRRPGAPDAYVVSVDEILTLADDACREGATELHLVGGIHPDLPYTYYRGLIARLHEAFPSLHLKAFTAVEIIDLAAKASRPVETVLEDLAGLGLASLPGGGAEILDAGYLARFAPRKPPPEQWLAVHAAAHRLGLMTNATMLFGYHDSPELRVRHLLRLRKLQDESLAAGRGAFQCFVPLPWVSGGTAEADPAGREGFLELKTLAVSRLLLDNIPHVKAFWPILGLRLAQVALGFGADDLEGTVGEYRIVAPDTRAGGSEPERTARSDGLDDESGPAERRETSHPHRAGLTVTDLQRLIRETGRVPVQRDGFYRPVTGPLDSGG